MSYVVIAPKGGTIALPKGTKDKLSRRRTGCITCKIRHVKCDEQKPHCQRCSSTGRKCDGYTSIETKADRNTTKLLVETSKSSPTKQLIAHVGSVNDRRALDYFYQCTVPQLSGLFSQDFWGRLVPQLSASEPAIRHALIAVSCFHEKTERFGRSPLASSSGPAMTDLAVYDKAVESLILTLGTDKCSIRIPLIACILFTCLEFLRGDMDAAMTHIESGINILKTTRNAKRLRGLESRNYLVWDSECADAELAPIFCTLGLLASLFGSPSFGIYSSPGTILGSFAETRYSSVFEAKVVLFDLLNTSLQFIESVGAAKRTLEIGIDETIEQIRIIGLLEQWKNAFEVFSESDKANWPDSEGCAADILRATFLAMKVRVAAALDANETVWDEYKLDYEEIVTIAERILSGSTHPSHESLGYFHFEPGIISPLHFVAWRCRWPIIRRKALSLLYLNPRVEGLYDSRRSYNVFQRVMMVEELALGIPPGGAPAADDLPPEWARIHQVDTTCEPATPVGTPINFISRPGGLSGKWHIRREFIHLGSMKVNGSSGTSAFMPHNNLGSDSSISASFLQHTPDLIPSGGFDIQEQNGNRSRSERYYRGKRLFAPGGPIVEGDPDEISPLGGMVSNFDFHTPTMPNRSRSFVGLSEPQPI